eukprot:11214269-Lingulodinium_polyedra.AAC.1
MERRPSHANPSTPRNSRASRSHSAHGTGFFAVQEHRTAPGTLPAGRGMLGTPWCPRKPGPLGPDAGSPAGN